MAATSPQSETDKIVRQKLSEQVLTRLRDMIGTGELRPGDQMPSERALMERFGVGRPAVREALQSLHTQGLITISHGERSRVNELSAHLVLGQSDKLARLVLDAAPANLEHLKQARRMFETGIVRAAAVKATQADVDRLWTLYENQRRHHFEGDPSKMFVAADMAFHRGIAGILGNPVITAASDAMLRWLYEYHMSLLAWSGNEEVTLGEHTRIIERIAAGDAEGSAAAMEKHLDRSQDLYLPRGGAEAAT